MTKCDNPNSENKNMPLNNSNPRSKINIFEQFHDWLAVGGGAPPLAVNIGHAYYLCCVNRAQNLASLQAAIVRCTGGSFLKFWAVGKPWGPLLKAMVVPAAVWWAMEYAPSDALFWAHKNMLSVKLSAAFFEASHKTRTVTGGVELARETFGKENLPAQWVMGTIAATGGTIC
eukprot:UC4_evm1s1085